MEEVNNKESVFLSTIAFIDDESITTNAHYLLEFCKVVLFEGNYRGLTATELRDNIKELVLFDYTEDEIVNIIEQCNNGDIVVHDGYYCLSSEAAREYEKRSKNSEIRKYVDLYCDTKLDDEQVDRAILCNLITRFLFEKFQESLDQIYRILDGGKDLQLAYSSEYEEEEKSFINSFLGWDNEAKNKMIYELIVKSYDFCTLNCSENATFDFGDFQFYLDANIIMRLLGINNAYRQDAVEHFINKCIQAGISLHITSFTKKEIQIAIENQINSICKDLQNKGFVPTPDGMKFAISDGFTIELYGKYYEFYKSNKKGRTLEEFKRNLLNQLDKTIKRFVYDDLDSYEILDKDYFNGLVESLKDIKDEKVARTDVNNIMHVLQARNDLPDRYLISADGKLVNWCKQIFVGKTSIVELPSVWLSLLLKYTGRAGGQDYAAFCKFIRLPLHTLDKDIRKKIQIKEMLLKLEAPIEIKNLMLEELSANYTNYVQYSNKRELVEKVHEKILKEHDDAIRTEVLKEADLKNQKTKQYYETRQFGLIQQLKKNSEIIEKQNDETVEVRINKTIEKKVNKKLQFGKWITDQYWWILLGLGIVTLAVVVVLFLCLRQFFIDKIAGLSVVLAITEFVLVYILKVALNAIKAKYTNEERLKVKISKRVNKKCKKIIG